ncbi:hypothetical protein [Amphritea japonica]|uniref:Uncharacterized protein n=1 Tax=Amphritea japonica ATCC BAA-1530 TaxID=1278309 RepID=A0A7R6SRB3_9GAMM|nr:hypothetical protein [Amphritea japonica]BBB24615.1 conserved hypothetical protein [Amphritea japonica ATCC BAA-1530]
MKQFVLFQMWEPSRKSFIAVHEFYVTQANKRLLAQFKDIETEARKAAEHWLEDNNHRFDPDRHDPGSFYEQAHDIEIEFYQLLSGMHNTTRLSVVAGMYHEWDKQFRDWMITEVNHWHHGNHTEAKIWSVDFGKIAELFKSLGWNIQSKSYFRKLDACRLVINIYKHGKGKSLEELKKKYPEYLRNPYGTFGDDFFELDFLDHTHLSITDAHVEEFSSAITGFWEDVPKTILKSQDFIVPNWLESAILKDLNSRTISK